MTTRCSVCQHPEAIEIDAALEAGETLEDIAAEFGVSRNAVHYHKKNGHRAALDAAQRGSQSKPRQGPMCVVNLNGKTVREALCVLRAAQRQITPEAILITITRDEEVPGRSTWPPRSSWRP